MRVAIALRPPRLKEPRNAKRRRRRASFRARCSSDVHDHVGSFVMWNAQAQESHRWFFATSSERRASFDANSKDDPMVMSCMSSIPH